MLAASRLVIKISGEALKGKGSLWEEGSCRRLAREIAQLHHEGKELILILGGGNILRGKDTQNLPLRRTDADTAGMLATQINGLVVNSFLEQEGLSSCLLSAIACPYPLLPYSISRAKASLAKGQIVICLGGIGQAFFSTDTAAALRACELEADLLVKATQVDGVYDADPKLNPKAKRFSHLSFTQILEKNLQVMDASAASLCRQENIPVFVTQLFAEHSLASLLMQPELGTLVKEGGDL